MPNQQALAPGARILVRDAEWQVRRTDRTSTGALEIDAIGLSEIVHDKAAMDTVPGGPIKCTIVYQAPFDKCDREQDYEIAWREFERRGVGRG